MSAKERTFLAWFRRICYKGLRWYVFGLPGVWLCDHAPHRPCTKLEIAESNQYCGLMVEVLTGQSQFYARDAEGKRPIAAPGIHICDTRNEEPPCLIQ